MDDPKRAKIEVLTSLVWSECKKLPNGVWDAQAVTLEEKVFVGGGKTSRTDANLGAELHIYLPKTNLWRGMHTPVYYFTLATYHSELILIGGYEFVDEGDDILTNKLWTLYKYTQWQETLPPMKSKRYSASAVSHGDHLIVAGGGNSYETLDIVEVYDGQHWSYIQPLPNTCGDMKSVVFDGNWYLMGGYDQDEEVYYASLDSLVTSNEMSQPSVWKELPNAPFWYSSPAVLGKRLISIGGGHLSLYNNAIYAYSQSTESWVHVGEIPIGMTNTCSIVLPTGELMIIGGLPESASNAVFKVTLEGSSELENQLHLIAETIRTLKQEVTRLEEECGSLIVENEHLKSQVSTTKQVFDRQTETDAGTDVLKTDIQAKVDESIKDENVVEEKSEGTTIFSLEERIKELQSNVEDLASQIDMYINQTTKKSSGRTYDADISKESDSIYDLKQDLLSLKKEKYSTQYAYCEEEDQRVKG